MLSLFGNNQLNPPPSLILSLVLTGWSHPPQLQVRSPIAFRRARVPRCQSPLPVTFWLPPVTRGRTVRVRSNVWCGGGVTRAEILPIPISLASTLPLAAGLNPGSRRSSGGGIKSVLCSPRSLCRPRLVRVRHRWQIPLSVDMAFPSNLLLRR